MVSWPPSPMMQSRLPVPFSVSLLDVPTITLVPEGQQAGLSPGPTATVAEQVEFPPRLSVQLSVTDVVPTAKGPAGTSTHVKGSLSGSVVPASTSAAVTVPRQDPAAASTATSR